VRRVEASSFDVLRFDLGGIHGKHCGGGTGHPDTFGIGRVIARTFRVTGQNFITFFLLALIARLPLLPLQLFEVSSAHPGLAPQQAMAAGFSPASILSDWIDSFPVIARFMLLYAGDPMCF
jgi:hypothetical protein